MKKMPDGECKARCLSVVENVRATRKPVLITKRGRPLVMLVPAEAERENFLGRLQGVVKIVGDLESPGD
jgi:prevent-host-death family protein